MVSPAEAGETHSSPGISWLHLGLYSGMEGFGQGQPWRHFQKELCDFQHLLQAPEMQELWGSEELGAPKLGLGLCLLSLLQLRLLVGADTGEMPLFSKTWHYEAGIWLRFIWGSQEHVPNSKEHSLSRAVTCPAWTGASAAGILRCPRAFVPVHGIVAGCQAAGVVFEMCDVEDLLRGLPAHKNQAGPSGLSRSGMGAWSCHGNAEPGLDFPNVYKSISHFICYFIILSLGITAAPHSQLVVLQPWITWSQQQPSFPTSPIPLQPSPQVPWDTAEDFTSHWTLTFWSHPFSLMFQPAVGSGGCHISPRLRTDKLLGWESWSSEVLIQVNSLSWTIPVQVIASKEVSQSTTSLCWSAHTLPPHILFTTQMWVLASLTVSARLTEFSYPALGNPPLKLASCFPPSLLWSCHALKQRLSAAVNG